MIKGIKLKKNQSFPIVFKKIPNHGIGNIPYFNQRNILLYRDSAKVFILWPMGNYLIPNQSYLKVDCINLIPHINIQRHKLPFCNASMGVFRNPDS